jgi:hypothetical protein
MCLYCTCVLCDIRTLLVHTYGNVCHDDACCTFSLSIHWPCTKQTTRFVGTDIHVRVLGHILQYTVGLHVWTAHHVGSTPSVPPLAVLRSPLATGHLQTDPSQILLHARSAVTLTTSMNAPRKDCPAPLAPLSVNIFIAGRCRRRILLHSVDTKRLRPALLWANRQTSFDF